MSDPFRTIVTARDSLDTAKNYLGDAVGALLVEIYVSEELQAALQEELDR